MIIYHSYSYTGNVLKESSALFSPAVFFSYCHRKLKRSAQTGSVLFFFHEIHRATGHTLSIIFLYSNFSVQKLGRYSFCVRTYFQKDLLTDHDNDDKKKKNESKRSRAYF